MTCNGKFLALLVAALMSVTGSARAVPITVPAGLSPGDSYRLVFVGTTLAGSSTNAPISVFDNIVTVDALGQPELSALGTTWQVLGSTGVANAREHTNTDFTNVTDPDVPIYNLQGARVATGNADFWDATLENAILFTRDGSLNMSTFSGVFTGTDEFGLAIPVQHLSTGGLTMAGLSTGTNFTWMRATAFAGSAFPLYGISGVLTVVPLPAAAWLFISAIGGLGFIARRRKQAA